MQPQIWIPIGMGLLSQIVLICGAYFYIKYKIDEHTEKLRDSTIEIKELRGGIGLLTNELSGIGTSLKTLTAEQQVVNRFTATILENLTLRIGLNEKTVTEAASTVTLIKELYMKHGGEEE